MKSWSAGFCCEDKRPLTRLTMPVDSPEWGDHQRLRGLPARDRAAGPLIRKIRNPEIISVTCIAKARAETQLLVQRKLKIQLRVALSKAAKPDQCAQTGLRPWIAELKINYSRGRGEGKALSADTDVHGRAAHDSIHRRSHARLIKIQSGDA